MPLSCHLSWPLLLSGFLVAPVCRPDAPAYDLVIAGGQVIDPESGLNAVRHVGIRGDRIAAVSETPLQGKRTIDASRLVVAPGFIDLHSHGQTLAADRMQAFDGVTTALELESGLLPIAAWYDRQASGGRAVNYGASAGWSFARISVLEGLDPEPDIQWFFQAFKHTAWVNRVASQEQVERIIKRTEEGLKQGGLGVGITAGYAPGYGYKEMLAIHQLAARYQVPTFTHIRSMGLVDPGSSLESYGELISLAAATGSHVHICHFNSTSLRDIDKAAEMVQVAQRGRLKITVEAYPYAAASTGIGAAIFKDDNLARMGLTYSHFEYNGKRLNEKTFKELRARDPGAIIIFHYLELPRDQALLDRAVLFPGGVIASDAMPWLNVKTGKPIDATAWPLSDDARAHPRSAGTFARFIKEWVRERKKVTLAEALRRCSYEPAKILGESVPQMKKKGRLQAGMDADVIVFDPQAVADRATFEKPNQTSVGMKYVLVNGTVLIDNGDLNRHAKPGQPVRRPVSK